VEENTAAAQSMVEQSQALEKLMSFFTLNEHEEGRDTHAKGAVDTSHGKITAFTKPEARRAVASGGKAANPAVRHAATSAAHHSVKPAAKAVGSDKMEYNKDWKEF
jgi:hypothetical protein